MKILKRNQIIISVLALMLITVGYMSYTSNVKDSLQTGALLDSETMAGIGDARLVNSNNSVENSENSSQNTEKNDNNENSTNSSDNSNDENVNNDKTAASSVSLQDDATEDGVSTDATSSSSSNLKTTSATNYQADYFVGSRLERDKMYSQMLETYQGLLESSTISPEQKNISSQEITNINNRKNSIMIAENLIKNLGFEDVVIFVNDNSTSVIVKAEKLSEADVAQIQNVVCREIGVDVETIHISLK